jgi:hypothetical protein
MKLRVVRSLGLILAMVLSMTACGDYNIRLPGGYSLARVYAGAFLIFRDRDGRGLGGDVVVNATVDSYQVLDGLVVGHVSTLDYMSPEEKEVSKPGYFILNTKTHKAKQGLDKKAWLDSLKVQGVSSEPSLSKPSRFDRDYQ